MGQPTNQTISWKEVAALVSPSGQKQLVDFIRQAQAERGANWLPEIQRDYPTFSWLVELVCNRTADEALEELNNEFPIFPLWMIEGQLRQLHATLLAEIDKKR